MKYCGKVFEIYVTSGRNDVITHIVYLVELLFIFSWTQHPSYKVIANSGVDGPNECDSMDVNCPGFANSEVDGLDERN